jgi:hypothetical protein
MFASRASTGVCIGLLASLLGALPAAALTQKECSEKYQVAKAAGTLGDKSWSDFRKECAANGATTTTAPDTKANKATNANGGLKWIMKGGGYYSECNKRLKS